MTIFSQNFVPRVLRKRCHCNFSRSRRQHTRTGFKKAKLGGGKQDIFRCSYPAGKGPHVQLVNNPQKSEFSNLWPSHVRRDTIAEKVGSSGCLSLGGKSFFLPALHAMSLSLSHFCPLTHPLCTHSTRGKVIGGR